MEPSSTDWEDHWAQGHTPWDLRGVTPPLEALVRSGFFTQRQIGQSSRVLVPGCGRGHDLRVFGDLGCEVTGLDIVPAAVAEARSLLTLNRAGGTIEVQCRDVLGLGPEWDGQWDLIFDYTCFCALQPHLRAAYADVVCRLLKPGGRLLHLAFPMDAGRDPKAGPPFRITEPDVRRAFGRGLHLEESLDPISSVGERHGKERWFVWRKESE